MIKGLVILTLLITITFQQQEFIYSVSLTPHEATLQSTCVLTIKNTEDYLNFLLSRKCEIQSEWSMYIPQSKGYLIHTNGSDFVGYRYFKSPIHYKNSKNIFIAFKQLLAQYLEEKGLKALRVELQDLFTLSLRYVSQNKWEVISLKVEYPFTKVAKPQSLSNNYIFQFQAFNETRIRGLQIEKDIATRKLSGRGLHQDVNLTLSLTGETDLQIVPQKCSLILAQVLPESTYIDADQLRSIKKQQIIDVEKPQHFSKQYYFQYSVPLDRLREVGPRKYNLIYPIHFRYPEPSNLNYTKVALHPLDWLKIRCEGREFQILQDPFNDRGYANIFTGSKEDSRIVSMVTFILMIVGAMIVVKQLRRDE